MVAQIKHRIHVSSTEIFRVTFILNSVPDGRVNMACGGPSNELHTLSSSSEESLEYHSGHTTDFVSLSDGDSGESSDPDPTLQFDRLSLRDSGVSLAGRIRRRGRGRGRGRQSTRRSVAPQYHWTEDNTGFSDYETNREAARVKARQPENYYAKRFAPVTVPEMQAFFGCRVLWKWCCTSQGK